jgi:hypothetical protein
MVGINMFRLSDLLRSVMAAWNGLKLLLECLHKAKLAVIDNPEKTQQTTAIETLF